MHLLAQALHLPRRLPCTLEPEKPHWELCQWLVLCLVVAGPRDAWRLLKHSLWAHCEGVSGRHGFEPVASEADGLPVWLGVTSPEFWAEQKEEEGYRLLRLPGRERPSPALGLVLRPSHGPAHNLHPLPRRPQKRTDTLLGLQPADGRWWDFSASRMVRVNQCIIINLFLERKLAIPSLVYNCVCLSLYLCLHIIGGDIRTTHLCHTYSYLCLCA